MRKTLGILIGLSLLLPSLAFSGAISIRAGYFIPRAGDPSNHESDLWTMEFDNMSFVKSDFQNTTFGLFYEHFLTRQLSLVIGIEPYSQFRSGLYRDYIGYENPEGLPEGFFAFLPEYTAVKPLDAFNIMHSFNVSVTPIQASIKLAPLGRRSRLIPYLGGGISLFIWSVKLFGDIIDFTDEREYIDPNLGKVPIYGLAFADLRDETNFSLGFHGFAGVLIPVASRLAFEAEFRYNYGKGGLDKFQGFESFDLSGYQVSLGLNFWF